LLACGLAATLTWIGYRRTAHGNTDWVFFEVGARVLVHYHHNNIYGGNRWHLYLENVDLQIGPPAFWLVAAFEWLPVRTLYGLFAIIMGFFGLGAVGAARLAGGWARKPLVQHPTGRLAAFLMGAAGVTTTGIVCYQISVWKHLDDVIAILCATAAAALVAKGRGWWAIGCLLGLGVATKPWAVILTPMILGLPRKDRARTTLVALLVAAAWWAPFVISAPATIQGLGHYRVLPYPGSVLYLIGLHDPVERWLRPVQFTAGLAAGILAARRRDWLAAPLAALAVRVATDPYAFGYYGLAPLVFAYMYDRSGRSPRSLPVLTFATAVLEFGLPRLRLDSAWVASGKLAWVAAVVFVIFLARTDRSPATRSNSDTSDPTHAVG
jgi:hypothetical protein